MSIRITYRNNFFYYLMMPGLWISGAFATKPGGAPTLRRRPPSLTRTSRATWPP